MQVIRIYPLVNIGGGSGLFLAFLSAVGLGEGDVENDLDLKDQQSPL